MANTDKNILITPNKGQTAYPKIEFTGADNNTVSLTVLDDGTLSFEGSAGQLFSISDDLTGTIFSVNDVSGIPSIEVDDTGEVRIAEYYGRVLIGTSTDNGTDKLQIDGSISASGGFKGNADTATKLATTRNIALSGAVTGNANFDGSGNIAISTTLSGDAGFLPTSGGTMTGDLSFGSQTGTWITSNAMTDSIGWNPSYGVYIGSNIGGTHYLRANGTITTGGGTYNLWHSGNDGGGSGLDADKLDGLHASEIIAAASGGGGGADAEAMIAYAIALG